MTINHTELLPSHMVGAMQRYIENRLHPGSFLTAVLSNDLADAVGRADDINRDRISDIVTWLYNYAPSGCWGNPDKVASWLSGEQAEANAHNDEAERREAYAREEWELKHDGDEQ